MNKKPLLMYIINKIFLVSFVSFSFCFFSDLCFGTMDHFNYMGKPNYGWVEPHFSNVGIFESPYNTWKKKQQVKG